MPAARILLNSSPLVLLTKVLFPFCLLLSSVLGVHVTGLTRSAIVFVSKRRAILLLLRLQLTPRIVSLPVSPTSCRWLDLVKNRRDMYQFWTPSDRLFWARKYLAIWTQSTDEVVQLASCREGLGLPFVFYDPYP